MPPFPSIPFHLSCDRDFTIAARHAITMLGLIAGFTPRWISTHGAAPGSEGGKDSGAGMEGGEDSDAGMLGGKDPAAAGGCVCWGCAGGGTLHLEADPAAQRFLFEKGEYDPARARNVDVAGRRVLALFGTDAGPDLIASTFFFLSLHEEWSSPARDAFDRFPAEESLLGRRGELGRCVVAEYALALRDLLVQAGFACSGAGRFAGRTWAVCMTHDIDYLRKLTPGLLYRESFKYLLANQLHQSWAIRLRRFAEYLSFLDPRRDPYRVSFERLLGRERRHGVRSTWFFKSAVTDKRDARYSLVSGYVRRMFNRLREDGHELGLHPAFRTHVDAGSMHRERARLERASGADVASVRQHYLRFVYPRTWQAEVEAGFQVGSTLGFAGHEGCRNGTCHPFLPFDLERRRTIPFFEIPLHVMDGTLHSYRGMAPESAVRAFSAVLDAVRVMGGIAVLLFHNTSDDGHDFPGWSDVADTVYARLGAEGDAQRAPLRETLASWLAGSGWTDAAEVARAIEAPADV